MKNYFGPPFPPNLIVIYFFVYFFNLTKNTLQFVKVLMEGTLHKNKLGVLWFAFMIMY
jgi:hypothetical protein